VRRPTTTSSDQILINRLGTMAEPFPGLCLVAVRGFSVMVAGAMLAVYALGLLVSQILALPEPGRDWPCGCFGDGNQTCTRRTVVLPGVICLVVSGPSALAFWR
jgi:hypothetical protein